MEYLGTIASAFVVGSLLLSSCSSPTILQTLNGRIPKLDSGKESKAIKEVVISDLCVLYRDPVPYDGQLIKINTELSSIGSITSIGDNRCPMRHFLVDLEFSPEFESSVCASDGNTEEAICSIAKASRGAVRNLDIKMQAEVKGQLNIYKTKQGFTLDGYRLRLQVQDIKNVEKIEPVLKSDFITFTNTPDRPE